MAAPMFTMKIQENITKQIRDGFDRGIQQGVDAAVLELIRVLKGPKILSGGVLQVRSGQLKREWHTVRAKRVGTGWVGGIATPTVYARIHHFGGKTGRGRQVTMPARRYITRSIEIAEPQMVQVMQAAIVENLKR